MTSLVACLGAGKGTWNEVARLVSAESWTNIFLITNEFGRENFVQKFPAIKAEIIVVNDFSPAQQIVDEIRKGLAGKLKGTEAAVNMASGTGNVHMAMISALLKLGMGMRFVVPGDSGALEL